MMPKCSEMNLYAARGEVIVIKNDEIMVIDQGSGESLAVPKERRLGWGGALMTSGSFTMMASAGN